MAQSKWLRRVEERAYERLRQLRSMNLWNGKPPIPVEFVLESCLGVRICWEPVDELPGERILACFRPDKREVVLNERRRDEFERSPGLERFSLAHEAGHADLFFHPTTGDALSLLAGPEPRLSRSKSDELQFSDRYKSLSRQQKTEVMLGIADEMKRRRAGGEDSSFERRTVDHYAAVLLMPEDLVRTELTGRDACGWLTIQALATSFAVSRTAMRIRFEELGLIGGVDSAGEIYLPPLASPDQGLLF